jgi:hypothetical protein
VQFPDIKYFCSNAATAHDFRNSSDSFGALAAIRRTSSCASQCGAVRYRLGLELLMLTSASAANLAVTLSCATIGNAQRRIRKSVNVAKRKGPKPGEPGPVGSVHDVQPSEDRKSV